jgi:hypothetical protein
MLNTKTGDVMMFKGKLSAGETGDRNFGTRFPAKGKRFFAKKSKNNHSKGTGNRFMYRRKLN